MRLGLMTQRLKMVEVDEMIKTAIACHRHKSRAGLGWLSCPAHASTQSNANGLFGPRIVGAAQHSHQGRELVKLEG